MTRIPAIVAVLVVALAGACGSSGSSSDSAASSAENQVCASTADIHKQLNGLAAITPATFTVDGVKSHVTAIQSDLSAIQGALPDLTSQRKQQVQAATQQFMAQLNTITSNVLRSLSLTDAQAQVKSAAASLEAAYRQSFAKLNCAG
jgi:cytochrome c556